MQTGCHAMASCHSGFKCTDCGGAIWGIRHWCPICEVNLCGSCQARKPHELTRACRVVVDLSRPQTRTQGPPRLTKELKTPHPGVPVGLKCSGGCAHQIGRHSFYWQCGDCADLVVLCGGCGGRRLAHRNDHTLVRVCSDSLFPTTNSGMPSALLERPRGRKWPKHSNRPARSQRHHAWGGEVAPPPVSAGCSLAAQRGGGRGGGPVPSAIRPARVPTCEHNFVQSTSMIIAERPDRASPTLASHPSVAGSAAAVVARSLVDVASAPAEFQAERPLTVACSSALSGFPGAPLMTPEPVEFPEIAVHVARSFCAR